MSVVFFRVLRDWSLALKSTTTIGSVPVDTGSASTLNINGQVDHDSLLMIGQTDLHNEIGTKWVPPRLPRSRLFTHVPQFSSNHAHMAASSCLASRVSISTLPSFKRLKFGAEGILLLLHGVCFLTVSPFMISAGSLSAPNTNGKVDQDDLLKFSQIDRHNKIGTT